MAIETAPTSVQQARVRPVAAPASRHALLTAGLLWLILVAGAGLRLNGLDWDDGKLLHPDERHIVDVVANRIHAPALDTIFDARHSSLNPRSVVPNPGPGVDPNRPRQFAYGSLPLFVTDLVAWFWGGLTGQNWNEFWQVFRVGRLLTVLFDLATVALTWALARRAYGDPAGLLAAAFMALATMPVQLAHFFVTDTWLTTFVTAALLATLAGAQEGRTRTFALAGGLLGCAMATKGSVVLFAFTIAVAAGLAARERTRGRSRRDFAVHVVRYGAAAAGATALMFFIFEPYAVLDPATYLRDIGEQSTIVSGAFDVPFTRRYVGTIPLVYQAGNLLTWELGPPLGALTLCGLAFVGWRAWRRRGTADLVLLAWVVPYLLLLAFNEIKFMRYLLPVLPPLLIFGGSLLVELGAFGAARRGGRGGAAGADAGLMPDVPRSNGVVGLNGHGAPAEAGRPAPRPGRRALDKGGVAASALAVSVVLATGLTSVAFSAIYGRPHTRVAASEWIYTNIRPGSTLSNEYWDDQLPLPLEGSRSVSEYRYESIRFDMYNDIPACDTSGGKTPPPALCRPNNAATLDYLIGQLEKVEYVIQSSERISGSIARLPWRYPVQQHYYDLLHDGRLGFTKVYEGTSRPALGPVSFPDDYMDETFVNYDHPHVFIFRKERDLSRDELRALFAPVLDRPVSATRQPPAGALGLMLDELVDRLPAVGDYAWNRAAAGNGALATLLWLLAVEALGLLALPLTLRLCRAFPDRGWGLSKLVGWLLLAYPIWLGASLRITRFTLPFLLLVLGLGLALAAAAGYRWRGPLHASLREARPAILLSEAIFLVAGGFFLILRAKNPDLWHTFWGGEKPMELTHINGILRSPFFPPLDPWYADGVINYYYFGQYLVATLIKLTGLPVAVAFNLAMPTVSALVAGAAFSVAAALARLALRRRPDAAGEGALAFGLLGAILFVGIGNLDGLARVIGRARDGGAAPFRFDDFVWGGSRTVDGAITEAPFFTQLWADLHAHAVALPFTILTVGLVIALVSGDHGHVAGGGAARRLPAELLPGLALLALTIGALICTNAWDVPTYLLVTGAGLFHLPHLGRMTRVGAADRRALARDVVRRLGVAVAGTALVGIGAYLLYLPFLRAFRVVGAGGLARTRVPTPLPQYLDHFGLFVGITVATLAAGFLVFGRGRGAGKRGIATVGGALAVLAAVIGLRVGSITGWLATHTPLFADEVPASGVPYAENAGAAALLALLLVLLVTLWLLAWGELRLQLPLALLIAAVGVTLGPEVIFVADDLQGGEPGPGIVIWERMNTVFKFYLQGWTLFALGGIGALAWLYDSAPRWSSTPFRRLRNRVDRRFNAIALRGVVAGLLGLLLLGSLVYPVVATPIRVAERFPQPAGLGPTLDGYRWMDYALMPRCEFCSVEDGAAISFRDDHAAIRWLNGTIVGTPVIAEASIGPYRGNGSRFTIATGLPTILGWERHEYQQRPPASLPVRAQDVRTLYDGIDVSAKLAVLQRYHVSYVIVGAIERGWHYSSPAGVGERYASPEGLAALEGLVGRGLEPVFRSGGTVVYRVTPEAFSSGSDADERAGRVAAR